jgi:hypothetical protein
LFLLLVKSHSFFLSHPLNSHSRKGISLFFSSPFVLISVKLDFDQLDNNNKKTKQTGTIMQAGKGEKAAGNIEWDFDLGSEDSSASPRSPLRKKKRRKKSPSNPGDRLVILEFTFYSRSNFSRFSVLIFSF